MLWLQAQADLAVPSDFAAGEAVNRLHDALEQFLSAIYRHYEGEDERVGFPGYPEQVKSASGIRLLHSHLVKEINDMRVCVKHHGNLPHYSDVRGLLPRCTRFLDDNCKAFFDRPFSAIRLSSFIEHERVREYVGQAEDQLAAGDLIETLVLLQGAFQTFMSDAISDRLPRGAGHLLSSLFNPSSADIRKAFEPDARQIVDKLIERTKELERLIESQAIGVNPLERARV